MSISNKVKSFFEAVMKPSPAAISQAIKTLNLKPHSPLIKFRKGSGQAGGHGSAPNSASLGAVGPATQGNAPTTPLKPNQSYQLPVLEDWQLPMKYRRRPIDQEEIDFINRGGPDKF